MTPLILDLATAPLPNASEWLQDDEIQAPANYKAPEAIAAYIEREQAKRLERAALDPDLCRIAAVGFLLPRQSDVRVELVKNYDGDETRMLRYVIEHVIGYPNDPMVTGLMGFNLFRFDAPVLLRRAMYLGLNLRINLDRYRSPHIDVYDALSARGLSSAKSLSFYVKRFGWTDLVKPLSGAEEAQVFQSGRWDELAASVRHDVLATSRLAQKMGLIWKESEPVF